MDTILTGLNLLALPYCEGIDCELGIKLSKASCLLSQEAFAATPSTLHLINAGRSISNCVVGFSGWGKHEELIKVAEEAISWLEKAIEQFKIRVSTTDDIKNEISEIVKDHIVRLRRYQIEAHIELAQFDEAKEPLQQAKQLLPANQATERYLSDTVEQQLKEIIIPPTVLRSEQQHTDHEDVITEFRGQMIDGLGAVIKDLAEDPDWTGIANVWSEAEPKLRKEVHEKMPNSLEEWAAHTESMRGFVTDFMTGKTQGREDFLELVYDMNKKKSEILFNDFKEAWALPPELKQKWYQFLNGIDLSINTAVEEIEALKEEVEAELRGSYKWLGLWDFDKLNAFINELRRLQSQLAKLTILCRNYHG